MKGLLIFCFVLAVATAVPLKGKPKNYSRKQNRQDAVNVPSPTPSAQVPVMAGAAPVDIIATRPVVGNKPFGETEEAARPIPVVPAKEPEVAPSQATVVQPTVAQPAIVAQPVPAQPAAANVAQPVSVAQPAPVPAQPVPASVAPVPAVPAPAEPVVPAPAGPAVPVPAQPVAPVLLIQVAQVSNSSVPSAGEAEPAVQPAVPPPPPVVVEPSVAPLAPGTEPVAVTPAPVEVSTKKPESEEDDSSSEEEEEAEARQLAVKPSSSSSSGQTQLGQKVVNAFVTPNGEVLVPLDVYQKYFHQHQAGRRNQVPLGIFSRQENEAGSSSGSSEEENDADASGENSEESNPAKKPEKVKPVEKEPEANVNEEDDNEEKEKPAAENETDDKSAESEEKPAAAAESSAPVEPVNSFVRPPLAAIPATRPTQEDDEEEAGRYGFPFYDDFFQDGPYENEFFGNNYYRIEPQDEDSSFEF